MTEKFQSTLPVRGATRSEGIQCDEERHFNPRSPCGERHFVYNLLQAGSVISIHAPRAGSDPESEFLLRVDPDISIHAPRAGSDVHTGPHGLGGVHFNPRSPCGERRVLRSRRNRPAEDFNPRSPCGERLKSPSVSVKKSAFQSTLPVRGATGVGETARPQPQHFNPRSPCGERLGMTPKAPPAGRFQSTLPVRGATAADAWQAQAERISIHAPRAGSDGSRRPAAPPSSFQSTLPVRGATHQRGRHRAPAQISIHAPRAGSDRPVLENPAVAANFNPRSPCGERPRRRPDTPSASAFQSTLPVRGATGVTFRLLEIHDISIHAPRAGSDNEKQHDPHPLRHFNPRSPCGERPPAARGTP